MYHAYYPKSPGIGTSKPVTLVRRSESDNKWMDNKIYILGSLMCSWYDITVARTFYIFHRFHLKAKYHKLFVNSMCGGTWTQTYAQPLSGKTTTLPCMSQACRNASHYFPSKHCFSSVYGAAMSLRNLFSSMEIWMVGAVFLCGVHLLSTCLCGFSPGALVSHQMTNKNVKFQASSAKVLTWLC